MKTNIKKIGAVALAVGLCLCATQAFAQVTTTTTTSGNGAFTEYSPDSHVFVIRGESGPLRYGVTKETTVVDETGTPVSIERISAGSPVSVQYSGTGDHLVASRIVVQRPAAATVTDQQTTTTVTRPATHDEKHAMKEAREHPERADKEMRELEEKQAKKEKEPDHD